MHFRTSVTLVTFVAPKSKSSQNQIKIKSDQIIGNPNVLGNHNNNRELLGNPENPSRNPSKILAILNNPGRILVIPSNS